MSSRKILIVIIVVLFIVVCVGLYFLFFAQKATTGGGVQTGQTGSAGSLPNAGVQSNPVTTSTSLAKGFGMISNEPVLDYFVSAANTVTAIEPSGKVVQVVNGQVSTINAILMQNIIGASFSYDGAKILVSFGDPTNPQVSVFDVASSTWTPLAAGLQSPTWSPSDYRVAYYTANTTQGTEAFATIDTSKTKMVPTTLMTLHAQDLSIVWPTKNQLVLYTKPSAYVTGSVWTLGLQNLALTPIVLETPGLDMLWNGEGVAAPAASSSAPMELEFTSGDAGLGGSVALTDALGNVLQQLKFATLPSKCLFATANSTSPATSTTPYLYCGVPRDTNTFSISHLPDDYNQMALFTSDDIYRVNLQSGAIDPVFNDQTQNLDVSDMKFFNNTVFFINRYDQKLYGIQLVSGS
jgi:hypothetical protein